MNLEETVPVLAASHLFRGVAADHIPALLDCIGAHTVSCEAGGFFFRRGSHAPEISVLVEGEAVGERLSADGTVAVVNEIRRGDVFGDVLSGASIESIVDVRARTRCAAVSFALENLLAPCSDSRGDQTILLRNFVNLISDKYFTLHARLAIVLCASLRAKIARYLLTCSPHTDAASFIVPHNREEMAGFLGCERSALSRELSRMRRDGLITFDRRQFTMMNRAEVEKLGN